MAVGSSRTISPTHQAKVGRTQGADTLFVGEAGNFAFFDYQFTGKELRNLLRSLCTATKNEASGTTMMSTHSLFRVPYGFQLYSAGTGFSQLSQKLPVPETGQLLILKFAPGGGFNSANVSIYASSGGGVTGCSLQGMNGTVLSSLHINTSVLNGSYATIRLLCQTAGTWEVVQAVGVGITQAANA